MSNVGCSLLAESRWRGGVIGVRYSSRRAADLRFVPNRSQREYSSAPFGTPSSKGFPDAFLQLRGLRLEKGPGPGSRSPDAHQSAWDLPSHKAHETRATERSSLNPRHTGTMLADLLDRLGHELVGETLAVRKPSDPQ